MNSPESDKPQHRRTRGNGLMSLQPIMLALLVLSAVIICVLPIAVAASQSETIAAPQTRLTVSLPQPHTVTEQLTQQDLEAGAAKAEKAAEDIFRGLEPAKEQIGKTQTRKQGMDYGHQKASQKLENLADRARHAETPGDLNPVDQRFLEDVKGMDLGPADQTLIERLSPDEGQ